MAEPKQGCPICDCGEEVFETNGFIKGNGSCIGALSEKLQGAPGLKEEDAEGGRIRKRIGQPDRKTLFFRERTQLFRSSSGSGYLFLQREQRGNALVVIGNPNAGEHLPKHRADLGSDLPTGFFSFGAKEESAHFLREAQGRKARFDFGFGRTRCKFDAIHLTKKFDCTPVPRELLMRDVGQEVERRKALYAEKMKAGANKNA